MSETSVMLVVNDKKFPGLSIVIGSGSVFDAEGVIDALVEGCPEDWDRYTIAKVRPNP